MKDKSTKVNMKIRIHQRTRTRRRLDASCGCRHPSQIIEQRLTHDVHLRVMPARLRITLEESQHGESRWRIRPEDRQRIAVGVQAEGDGARGGQPTQGLSLDA